MKNASTLLQTWRVLTMLTMIWACAVPAKADLDEILKDSSGELWQMAMFKRAELETIADDPNNSSLWQSKIEVVI